MQTPAKKKYVSPHFKNIDYYKSGRFFNPKTYSMVITIISAAKLIGGKQTRKLELKIAGLINI